MEPFLLASSVILWLAVVALSVVVFALARQIGLLHERIAPAAALMMNDLVKTGDPAPRLSVPALSGRERGVGAAAGRSQLVFFLSPTCPVCKSLLPAVQSSQRAEADWLEVIYASDGAGDGHAALARAHDIDPDDYVLSEELGRAFGVSKLPYAVLIDGDGRIASLGLVNSREHLESLFHAKETGVVSLQAYLTNSRERGGRRRDADAAAEA